MTATLLCIAIPGSRRSN